ncbi:MAG: hypothetical protein R2865_17380 [Deinococcales bacterium]
MVVKRGSKGASVYDRQGNRTDVLGLSCRNLQCSLGLVMLASGFIYGQIKGWDYYKSALAWAMLAGLLWSSTVKVILWGYEEEVLAFANSRGGL